MQNSIEDIYHNPVIAILPFSHDMMALGSLRPFVLHFPEHPLTDTIEAIIDQLISLDIAPEA